MSTDKPVESRKLYYTLDGWRHFDARQGFSTSFLTDKTGSYTLLVSYGDWRECMRISHDRKDHVTKELMIAQSELQYMTTALVITPERVTRFGVRDNQDAILFAQFVDRCYRAERTGYPVTYREYLARMREGDYNDYLDRLRTKDRLRKIEEFRDHTFPRGKRVSPTDKGPKP